MAPVITEEEEQGEIAIDDETAHQISVGTYLQISLFLYHTFHFKFPSQLAMPTPIDLDI
jgi:hypothetical protein